MTKMIYLSQREFFLVINGKKGLGKAQDVLKCNQKARFNKINKKKVVGETCLLVLALKQLLKKNGSKIFV